MWDYLPRYYRDSKNVLSIIEPEASEFSGLNAAILDVLNQYFIDSATWGLSRWEKVCGIPIDESKPYDQRRSVIKSRIRGMGTVTVAFVKSVAQAYEHGDLEVQEDNSRYTVVITFIGTRGVPASLPDVEAALREIIPAHLAIEFTFTYLVWNELDAKPQTWDQIDALGLTWDGLEVYKF